MQKKTGLDMEDHQVELFYYFREFIRRKGILAQYIIDFADQEWCDFPKFVLT